MKTKAMVSSCLICIFLLLIGYEYSSAGSTVGPKEIGNNAGLKIGVVNVRKAFRDSKKNARYRADTISEQSKFDADEEKLQKEVDSQKAALKALKIGSSDHLAQVKELLEKQAVLEAQRQFNNQKRILKEQQWTEDLYKEILRITGEVAEQKGLALVLEKREIEFPASSPDELMLTLSTHKLLYSGGCLDITDEVIQRIDGEK